MPNVLRGLFVWMCKNGERVHFDGGLHLIVHLPIARRCPLVQLHPVLRSHSNAAAVHWRRSIRRGWWENRNFPSLECFPRARERVRPLQGWPAIQGGIPVGGAQMFTFVCTVSVHRRYSGQRSSGTSVVCDGQGSLDAVRWIMLLIVGRLSPK